MMDLKDPQLENEEKVKLLRTIWEENSRWLTPSCDRWYVEAAAVTSFCYCYYFDFELSKLTFQNSSHTHFTSMKKNCKWLTYESVQNQKDFVKQTNCIIIFRCFAFRVNLQIIRNTFMEKSFCFKKNLWKSG